MTRFLAGWTGGLGVFLTTLQFAGAGGEAASVLRGGSEGEGELTVWTAMGDGHNPVTSSATGNTCWRG